MIDLIKQSLMLAGLTMVSLPTLADVQSLLQMVDYVGVDYPAAVAEGVVIHDGEYAEMREFAGRIATEVAALPDVPAREPLAALAGQLGEAVVGKSGAAQVGEITRRLRQGIMAGYDVVILPLHAPDLDRAKSVYAAQCANCHGETGNGDGAAGAGLDPPPTAFTDAERARQRSLYGLYNTIALGVPGTGMAAFDALSPVERWSLAFYVGAMSNSAPDAATALDEWRRLPVSLKDAVTLSPAEFAAARTGGEALAFRFRHEPRILFADAPHPIDFTLRTLAQGMDAFRAGNAEQARVLAITAYLEGFELTEPALNNVAPDLMRQTEQAMLEFRQSLGTDAAAEVETRYASLTKLLAEVRQALAGPSMSAGVAFSSSLIILLREGLEAILVLAAMIAFIVRSGRGDALRYVHGGWIVALAAGLLTWVASIYLIDISGATRELTEGVATLLAALVLIYVGLWMHRNASSAQWNAYLRGQIQSALSARALWTLAFISFLAVYREVFETILFYQALWIQVASGDHHAVYGGAFVAAVLLVVITWLVERFGVRLPLRHFFLGSALLMIALAVIFAGKGVMALQEAGMIGVRSLPLPRLEWIGFYPNVQVLTAQVVMLVVAAWILFLDRRVKADK
ncbi:MAG: cytochrome c/FTR1 family iron permease [Gammaproteobacteria bacterium]|nr:cytochrome c/FTR1 family iron permease [Gammaproteobacteria bacterium]